MRRPHLDIMIMNFFTRIAHWVQRMTGITSYRLKFYCDVIIIIGLLSAIVNTYSPVKTSHEIPKALVPILFIGVIAISFSAVLSRIKETRFLDNPEVIPHHPTPAILTWVRTYFALRDVLIGIPVAIGCTITSQYPLMDALFHLTAFAITCSLYFLDVAPLPPGTSKLGEWVKGLRQSFRKPVPVRAVAG